MTTEGAVAARVDVPVPASEILRVEDLCTSFFLPIGELQAVRGVSFILQRGRSLGIVGESGSGKTVLARSIMRLNVGANVKTTGSAFFEGKDLLSLESRRKDGSLSLFTWSAAVSPNGRFGRRMQWKTWISPTILNLY